MTLPEKHVDTLETLTKKFQDQKLNWAITGSTNLALQGLELEPDDIDIQTDKESAYRIDELLEENSLERLYLRESEEVISYFGRYQIGETEVELMGDLQKKVDDTWEDPVDPTEHLEYVQFSEIELPVLSLEYEAEAYKKMGRTTKAEKIEDHL